MNQTTVAAVFDRAPDAEIAIQALQEAGFERNHISLVARNNQSGLDTNASQSRNTGTAAGAGAAVGGIAGLLTGLGALAIPGIGPVIAAGPITAALGSAAIGAAAGGLAGALMSVNVPERDANYYAESVRRGDTLVTVETDDANEAERARAILDGSGASSTELKSAQALEQDRLNRTNDPSTPQMTLSGSRMFADGVEMDPRKSTFADFESDYQEDFARRFAQSGVVYDHFSPAYRYGYNLATGPRFAGAEWTEVEAQARHEWEERNPGSWPAVQDAVRYAWERARLRK